MTYVHINRPSSTRFQARVRPYGGRKYRLIGGPTKFKKRAVLRMATAFCNGDYKRGDVLMTADYYDPIMICELVKA